MSKELIFEFLCAAFRLEIANSFQIQGNVISLDLPSEKTVRITVTQTK